MPAANPEWIAAETYSRIIREFYQEAERIALEKVAKRIDRGIEAAGWAEQKLAEITILNRDMQRQIVDLRDATEPKVKEAIERGAEAGGKTAAAQLKAAGIDDLYADVAFARGQGIRALAEAAVVQLRTTHQAILRTTLDAYRDVVVESAAQVLTGAQTRREAAQAVLKRFANRGISGFTDASGRNWDVASYAEMSVRSAVMRSGNAGRYNKYEANGYDLVIVSQHAESCPLCDEWENRILSVSGNDSKHPSVADAEAAGLHHPNCSHTENLYIEGLTEPAADISKAENDAGYQERQRQRAIERTIRQWKRREAAAITDDEKNLSAAKTKEWQGKMREFIDDTGRRRKRERESISGAR